MLKKLSLLALIALSGCASLPFSGSSAGQKYTLEFQGGQTAEINITSNHPGIQTAIKAWIEQGLYNQAPVYRQVPQQFLLVGKPRLTGQPYFSGPALTSETKIGTQNIGNVGLVVHADGTLGPELMLHYGIRALSCCQNLQAVTIGTITRGSRNLATVKRGDTLLSTTSQP